MDVGKSRLGILVFIVVSTLLLLIREDKIFTCEYY